MISTSCRRMLQTFPCCFNDLQLRTKTPCDIDATRNGLNYWHEQETRGSSRRTRSKPSHKSLKRRPTGLRISTPDNAQRLFVRRLLFVTDPGARFCGAG